MKLQCNGNLYGMQPVIGHKPSDELPRHTILQTASIFSSALQMTWGFYS